MRSTGTFGMNSYAYCEALRDRLERQGVRIFEGTPVTRLSARGVETPGGTITARTVAVLTDHDLPALGLAAPAVYHVQAFLSASQRLSDRQVRIIFPENLLMVWDTDVIYHYFRITGEGRLLLGGGELRSMYSRNERQPNRRILRNFYAYLAAHFPSLTVQIEHLWSGRIGVSQDFAPVVGRHDVFPAVYFAGAGAGLPWAAALGEYLAQKITDGRAELDEMLSPNRSLPVGRSWQRLVGKPAAFALSHGIAKYLRH
jgi:gamma-glutamylputrescine oxidase